MPYAFDTPVWLYLLVFVPVPGNQTRSVCRGPGEEEDSLLMYVRMLHGL